MSDEEPSFILDFIIALTVIGVIILGISKYGMALIFILIILLCILALWIIYQLIRKLINSNKGKQLQEIILPFVTEQEIRDAKKMAEAEDFIARGMNDMAKVIYHEIVKNAPSETYPLWAEDNDNIYIKFWFEDDYIFYDNYHKFHGNNKKKIVWYPNVYPKAFWRLAFIALEEDAHEDLDKYVGKSLHLEPGNPYCFIELALSMQARGNPELAISYYYSVIQHIRPLNLPQMAMALRGMAVIYMDMGNLEYAEKLLFDSLKFERGNILACMEYFYIQETRCGAPPRKSTIRGSNPYHGRCFMCGKSISDTKEVYYHESRPVFICPECSRSRN